MTSKLIDLDFKPQDSKCASMEPWSSFLGVDPAEEEKKTMIHVRCNNSLALSLQYEQWETESLGPLRSFGDVRLCSLRCDMEECPWWTKPLWPVSSFRDRYGLSWAKRTARHPSGQTQLPNMKGVSPHMGRLSQASLWTPHWREQGPSSLTITGPYHKAPWQMTHNSFQCHVNGLDVSVVIALCGSKL